MKKNTITLILLTLFFFSSATQLFAAEQYQGSFFLHLYYENGSLKLEEEFSELTIEPSTANFVSPIRSYPLYTASLYDKNSNLLVSAKIDQRGSNSETKNGTVTIITPFDKKTDHVEISNENGKKVISLSIWNLCNYNNVCDSSLGETAQNCPDDCLAKPSPAQTSATPKATSPTTQRSSGNSFAIVLWIFSGIVLVAGLAMIYIAKKKQNQ